jgi:hypothetical protein
MINWIIGGLILGLTLYIIGRKVNKLRKGESACGGCSEYNKSGCSCDKKS